MPACTHDRLRPVRLALCALILSAACAGRAAAQSDGNQGSGPPPQGYPPQGYDPNQGSGPPPQGYPPQGYDPNQGYGPPPQGYPPQGYDPNQGYGPPPQGYPPQGYDPNQGYGPPPQGYPPQGYDPNQGYGPPPQGYPPNGYPPPGYGPPPPGADQTAGTAGQASSSGGATAGIVLGMGATSRSVDLPTTGGTQVLDTGFVPAYELRIAGRVFDQHWFIGGALAYQSSLGAQGTQAAPGPADEALSTPIRTHRYEVGVVPGARFTDSPDAVSLALFAGYGLRGFASVVKLNVPRYTLQGPLARLELEVPLSSRTFVLRIAPEVQYILSISRDLRVAGTVQDGGLAWGGEAALAVHAASWLSVQLAYRESHATASTGFSDDFTDVERFLLLDAVLQYF